jgi:hypothetical protein
VISISPLLADAAACERAADLEERARQSRHGLMRRVPPHQFEARWFEVRRFEARSVLAYRSQSSREAAEELTVARPFRARVFL